MNFPKPTTRTFWAALLLLALSPIALSSQTFKTYANFTNVDGSLPWAPLTQGTDGYLYGTNSNGGSGPCPSGYMGTYPGCGTIFKISPTGKLTTLFEFNVQKGSGPVGSLYQGASGDFYGTALAGGAETVCALGPSQCGIIYKMTPAGVVTTFYSFTYYDGAGPVGPLTFASDGYLYGATQGGGTVCNCGTIFRIDARGKLTTLHSFSDGADGSGPQGGVIQASDGNLYGTAFSGGDQKWNGGTVFKVTLPEGVFSVIHTFEEPTGINPQNALLQASDGNLYGTTLLGGVFSPLDEGWGTVFKIGLNGKYTLLHSFDVTDGDTPISALIEATDGDLYGTTSYNGEYPNYGTLFKITKSGTLTTLHNFDSKDGSYPYPGVIQKTDGVLYGTTYGGGPITPLCWYGCGTVFSYSIGQPAFISPVPAFGQVAAAVNILGTDLTGTTSVRFNGKPATFSVVSAAEIKAVVPVGATSGKVIVTTPTSTFESNVPFDVRP